MSHLSIQNSTLASVVEASTTPILEAANIGWYAAHTCSRHEKKIAQQLQDRGIDHFLPLYRSVRRWKDRKKEMELVLFPGYIFVRLNLADRLHVLELPGVVRFVSFNSRPAQVPANDIDALRNGLANNLCAEHHPYLTVGRRVKVVYGPLSGAEGIFVRRRNNARLVVSIDAIMRSVALEIDEADVVPVI